MKFLLPLTLLFLPLCGFAQTIKPTPPAPGVTTDKVIVGTVLPANPALAEMGQAVKALLNAYFDEINSAGGINNRKLELKLAENGDSASETKANLEKLLAQPEPFALVAAVTAGSDTEITSLVRDRQVPLIGPLTLLPQLNAPLNRHVFYVLSGVPTQARAIVRFISQRPDLKTGNIAILFSAGVIASPTVDAIYAQAQTDKLKTPQRYDISGGFDAARMAQQLKAEHADSVFFLGTSAQLIGFLTEADRLGWHPAVFSPTPTDREIFRAPTGFDGRLFISFPTVPGDQTAEGITEVRALADKYKLPLTRPASQVAAYAAAKIFVEALRRAGRDLTRDKLIQALEGLKDYQTSLTPAITYSPTRRVGASGAYVVTIDLKQKQFGSVSNWIAIE